MKPSNILMSVLFPLIFLVSISSNFVLKAEYDKLDKSDNFASYRKQKLPPFKHIKLGGAAFGVTQIQSGKGYEVRLTPEPKFLTWKMAGDTIIFTYHRDWPKDNNVPADHQLRAMPSFVIYAPSVESIYSQDVICKVTGLKIPSMHIEQTDGAIQITNSDIKSLDFQVIDKGFAKIDQTNHVTQAQLQIGGTSSMTIEKNIFTSFKMEVDSMAQVNVPGSLLK